MSFRTPVVLAFLLVIPIPWLYGSTHARAMDPIWRIVDEAVAQGRAPDLSAEPTETEAARRALDRDQMMAAQAWIDAYLSAFVAFDETHLATFHRKLEQMSLSERKLFLERFQVARDGLTRQRRAFDSRRKEAVKAAQRYREVTSRTSPPRRSTDVRDYFIRDTVTRSRPKRYAVYPPLITSRQVARISVYRGVFGRLFW